MEISAKSLKDNITINSVRVYNFGERKLTIVHIANGYSNKIEEKKNPKINFKAVWCLLQGWPSHNL